MKTIEIESQDRLNTYIDHFVITPTGNNITTVTDIIRIVMESFDCVLIDLNPKLLPKSYAKNPYLLAPIISRNLPFIVDVSYKGSPKKLYIRASYEQTPKTFIGKLRKALQEDGAVEMDLKDMPESLAVNPYHAVSRLKKEGMNCKVARIGTAAVRYVLVPETKKKK